VHAPIEEKIYYSNDGFYEELEYFFLNNFPKYYMKIVIEDFNAKVGGEKIFKTTIETESLHQDSSDKGFRSRSLYTSIRRAMKQFVVLRGADKSLARPTSRCRRTKG
jgi:hypothetical protein